MNRILHKLLFIMQTVVRELNIHQYSAIHTKKRLEHTKIEILYRLYVFATGKPGHKGEGSIFANVSL